jgi:anti-sigma B factor antagonist
MRGLRPAIRRRPADWLRSGNDPRGLIPGVNISCRAEHGYLVAALRGALDAASAPALREHLLYLVHDCAGRLVIDLSAVSHADASGLTVLVGTGRRARLLGGSLRLAAPGPAVAGTLTATGLERQFDIYATVEAATGGAA